MKSKCKTDKSKKNKYKKKKLALKFLIFLYHETFISFIDTEMDSKGAFWESDEQNIAVK